MLTASSSAATEDIQLLKQKDDESNLIAKMTSIENQIRVLTLSTNQIEKIVIDTAAAVNNNQEAVERVEDSVADVSSKLNRRK